MSRLSRSYCRPKPGFCPALDGHAFPDARGVSWCRGSRGLSLSEWLRELALGELIAHPAEQIILAEVLALRMLVGQKLVLPDDESEEDQGRSPRLFEAPKEPA